MKKLFFVLVTMALTAALLAGTTQAASLFTDDFSSENSEWGNEVGGWYVANGVYNTQSPSNDPNTYTSLPCNLRDFTIEVDFLDASDDGIWLRSSYSIGSGISGVLLVVGGKPTGYDGMYFHKFQNGSGSDPIATVDNKFTTGDNLHVKVDVSGITYTAYLYQGDLGIATTAFTDTDATVYSGRGVCMISVRDIRRLII